MLGFSPGYAELRVDDSTPGRETRVWLPGLRVADVLGMLVVDLGPEPHPFGGSGNLWGIATE